MSSSLSVTLDGSILAVPDVSCGAEQAYRFVEGLISWSRLIDDSPFNIVISGGALNALYDEKLYPARDRLRALFSTYNIDEYDVNTVAKIVETLLNFIPTFESQFGISDVLSDQLEIAPDVRQYTNYCKLQSDLARCLTMIALLRKCATKIGPEHLLVLRDAPNQVVTVSANIQIIEHSRVDMPTLNDEPEPFLGDVSVCSDFGGLVDSLNELAILVSATDDLGVKVAIHAALYKSSESNTEFSDWKRITTPVLGREFRELCQKICAQQNRATPNKILRAIVETINGWNMTDVHALREGPGGNEPQRMRGFDKAWRRDIDRDLHLHYWECADGTIELASVVHHNDESIPY